MYEIRANSVYSFLFGACAVSVFLCVFQSLYLSQISKLWKNLIMGFVQICTGLIQNQHESIILEELDPV